MKKEKDMQKELKDSAYKIWLAGLGALAVAGEEGKTLFHTLVEKGEEFEEKSRVRVDKVRGKVSGKVSDARSNVGQLWDNIQKGFDAQVTSALHRLGVPTRSEISTLTKRVEELTKSIEKTKKQAAPPRPKKATATAPASGEK
jgi:poly(hydroxyalkanoate) granule-associated protein